MFKRVVVLSACILVLSTALPAAEVTKMMGKEPGELPIKLNPGDRVKGPATVKTAAGDLMLLGKGSEIGVNTPSGDVEVFSVLSGWVQGVISGRTQLKLPVGTLLGPDEGQAEFYVENLKKTRALYRVNKGSALAVFGNFRVQLEKGFGIELMGDPKSPDVLDFKTLPGNPGGDRRLTISARISDTLDVDIEVSRATGGRVEPWQEGTRTKISSSVDSWQGGVLKIVTKPKPGASKTGELGPGTFAIINNVTGEIEFGFIEVDFAIIERAISLTSEFALLAVSNFFGLEELE